MNNQTIYSQKNLYPSHFHVFIKYIGFNWNSGKQIDMMMVWKKNPHGLVHFRYRYSLYLNPLLYFFFWQIVVEIEVALAANPDEKINLIRCPFCKQKNLRKNQDNHIRCWNCTRSTCFQCKKAISENPITKHFSTPNLCKQHSSWQIDLICKASPEFLFSFLGTRRPCLKKSWPPIGPIQNPC